MPKVRLRLRRGEQGAEVPARRQGREPRRDDESSVCPCRPASRSPPRRATPTWPAATQLPAGPHGRGRGRPRGARDEDGQAARRRLRPAARLGALRCAVLDARDDGHRPQPRPQRRVGAGARASRPSNERFAYDSYRRFVQMFGKIVLDVPGDLFEEKLHELVEEKGFTVDTELSADDLDAARRARSRRSCAPRPASTSPTIRTEQLRYAIEAVFKSWNGKRARDYRKFEGIADDLGTAVNVQTMVFGNKGDDSGTGVAFTRNPSTGESAALRRLPEERAGRRRRGRHPHHRAARRDEQRVPRAAQGAARRDEAAREPLPRHVRHRVHDRAGSPVHAADARRQAHRRGRAAHGGRDGRRGPDRRARSGAARAARAARPAPAPAVRPQGRVHACSPRA